MEQPVKAYSRGEVLPPPTERYTLLGWLHKNLFSTWYNSILTLVTAYIVFVLGKAILVWAFTQAEWQVVLVNMRLFMVGQYPVEQVWRIWLSIHLLAVTFGLAWGTLLGRRYLGAGIVVAIIPVALALFPKMALGVRLNLVLISVLGVGAWALGFTQRERKWVRALTRWLLLLYFPVLLLLVRGLGPDGFLAYVPTNLWGGLLLTFLLTIVGIGFSFPLGILLALGRRSELKVVHLFSVLYIEFIRGVPLVTVLFMAQVMLPLFLPPGFTIDRVLRAMTGIVLFSAAYMAENVRGGLQAIPKGQYEAAWALGLNSFQTMALIILPQALRNVIPVIVGQFIALFKDTSLVAIVGLLDLLGIASTVLAQPEFIGKQREVYTFIALIYWVFSYAMSYASRRLEEALGVGER